MLQIAKVELEQLKSAVNLVSLVRAKGIGLTEHGANLIGRCP